MICIEDLSIQNMMQNHNLAGSISSVGWFSFVTKLMYKNGAERMYRKYRELTHRQNFVVFADIKILDLR